MNSRPERADDVRRKLQRIVAARKMGHLRVIDGNAEQIPLPDASIGVVTSNGVLNLMPDESSSLVVDCRSRISRSGWRYRSNRAPIRALGRVRVRREGQGRGLIVCGSLFNTKHPN